MKTADPMDRPGDELDPDYAWTREDVRNYLGESQGSADRKLRAGRQARKIHRYVEAHFVAYDRREVEKHIKPQAAWRRASRRTSA